MIVPMGVMLISYSRVVSVVSEVGLHTLNSLHSSLSVIQQDIFKKIVLVVHTYEERNFHLHFEIKDTSVILKGDFNRRPKKIILLSKKNFTRAATKSFFHKFN